MKVDLHLHTTASDGKLTPSQLVELAIQRGFGIMAVTDHDSTEGVEEARGTAKGYPQLTVIPGVEMSTDIVDNEVHVLGYYVNCADVAFQAILKRLRDSRVLRAKSMVDKLAKLGMHIDWNRVVELANGGAIGRPHVAQALLERGYVPTMQEAFARYIGRKGPAYAEREKLTPVEAVHLIKQVRGLPVLAHPGDIDKLDEMIVQMKQAGMVGMEVYYNGYSRDTIQSLLAKARQYELIPTGGSDFHGQENDPEKDLGSAQVPEDSARRLIAMAECKV